jgi:hypothetical protein
MHSTTSYLSFTCMKKFTVRVLAVLLVGVGLSSCEEDAAAPADIEPGPVVTVNSYPLQVGNRWVYAMSSVITGDFSQDDHYMVEFSVELDTTIAGVACKKVRGTETAGTVVGNDRLGYRYFAHTNFGIEMLAYQGSDTQVFFKDEAVDRLTGYSLVSGMKMTAGDVVVRDIPLNYMRLPSVDGDIWVSHEFSEQANFKRQWDGYYTVTTEAGTFNCIRQQLFLDTDNDSIPQPGSLFLEQYISPEYGLIKEVHVSDLDFAGGETAVMVRVTNLVSKNF